MEQQGTPRTMPEEMQAKPPASRLATLLAMAIRLEPELYQEVRDLVARDERTGAYKNGFFRLSIDDELSRARILEYDLSLVAVRVLAIDDIEEQHGYNVAQDMLTTVVKELRLHTRDTDWVAQGSSWEEFIVVLPGCGEPQADRIVEKLRLALSQAEVSVKWGIDLPIQAQVELVTCTHGDTDTAFLLDQIQAAFRRIDRMGFEAGPDSGPEEGGQDDYGN
jgi:diguanylate cyclase (GGDEF)-like protein